MVLLCFRGCGRGITHFHGLKSGLHGCFYVRGTPLPCRAALRLYGGAQGAQVRGGWRLITQCLAVPSGLAAYHMLRPSSLAALCKQKHKPVPLRYLRPSSSSSSQQPFNWSLFAKFVLPDIVLLIVAVGVSVPYNVLHLVLIVCCRVQWWQLC